MLRRIANNSTNLDNETKQPLQEQQILLHRSLHPWVPQIPIKRDKKVGYGEETVIKIGH